MMCNAFFCFFFIISSAINRHINIISNLIIDELVLNVLLLLLLPMLPLLKPLRIYFLLNSIELSESFNLLALPPIPSHPKKMNENIQKRERERATSYLENSAISAAASATSVAMCVKLCSTKFIHIFELTDLSLLKL